MENSGAIIIDGRVNTVHGLINENDIPLIIREKYEDKIQKMVMFFAPGVIILIFVLYFVYIQQYRDFRNLYIYNDSSEHQGNYLTNITHNKNDYKIYSNKKAKTIIINDNISVKRCNIIKENHIQLSLNNSHLRDNTTIIILPYEASIGEIMIHTNHPLDKHISVTLLDHSDQITWKQHVHFIGYKHRIKFYDLDYSSGYKIQHMSNEEIALPLIESDEKIYVNDNNLAIRLTRDDEEHIPYSNIIYEN